MSAWEEYVSRITRGASQREVGERIGHSHTTARRWMSDGATPEQVIALTIAFRGDVIEALIAAGWLSAEAAEDMNVDSTLRKVSSYALVRELYRRAMVKHGRASGDTFAEVREPPNEV